MCHLKRLWLSWIKPRSFCGEAREEGPLTFHLLTLDLSTVLRRRGSCYTHNQRLEQQHRPAELPLLPAGEQFQCIMCRNCLPFNAKHHVGPRMPSPQADPGALRRLFCHTRHDVTSVAQSHSLQLRKAWSPGTPAAVLVNRAAAGELLPGQQPAFWAVLATVQEMPPEPG